MQVGRQKSRFWAYIWLHCLLLTLQQARCCQYDAAGPPSRKLWQLSLVVSGGVDSGKRRRSVYDKKPQRYAKDNRTAHLTARSDKSVAYVTNNKRVLDFCTRSLLLLTGTKHGAASLRQQGYLLKLSPQSVEITDWGRLFQIFTTRIVNEYFFVNKT